MHGGGEEIAPRHVFPLLYVRMSVCMHGGGEEKIAPMYNPLVRAYVYAYMRVHVYVSVCVHACA